MGSVYTLHLTCFCQEYTHFAWPVHTHAKACRSKTLQMYSHNDIQPWKPVLHFVVTRARTLLGPVCCITWHSLWGTHTVLRSVALLYQLFTRPVYIIVLYNLTLASSSLPVFVQNCTVHLYTQKGQPSLCNYTTEPAYWCEITLTNCMDQSKLDILSSTVIFRGRIWLGLSTVWNFIPKKLLFGLDKARLELSQRRSISLLSTTHPPEEVFGHFQARYKAKFRYAT